MLYLGAPALAKHIMKWIVGETAINITVHTAKTPQNVMRLKK